ncbi:MAG: hypothetical protein ACYDHH_09030 [Solirubrobacteraceae bacterium]
MGLIRGIGGPSSNATGRQAMVPAQEERRRAGRAGVIASGTLACARCDAPVAPGPRALAITDQLCCPFCDHSGPVRDFLSLAVPNRPARVTIRVARRTVSNA